MRTILAAVAFLAVSAPAFALTPATEAFLNELGLKADSKEVATVAKDVVNGKSLDTLAAKRDETGVRSFIATRNFIRAFKADVNAEFPADELYNIAYLTGAEKIYISTKLAESWPPMPAPKTKAA